MCICIYEGHHIHAYMKVIRLRSRSQRQQGRKSLFPLCKTSISNNSGFIKRRAIRFVCSMGSSAMADQVVWPPSLSHDRKWPRITKCTHSLVVGLRLEGFVAVVAAVIHSMCLYVFTEHHISSSARFLCSKVSAVYQQLCLHETHSTKYLLHSLSLRAYSCCNIVVSSYCSCFTTSVLCVLHVTERNLILIMSYEARVDPDLLAVSPQMMLLIHQAVPVGCHYFPRGLWIPSQPQSVTTCIKLYCCVTGEQKCE